MLGPKLVGSPLDPLFKPPICKIWVYPRGVLKFELGTDVQPNVSTTTL